MALVDEAYSSVFLEVSPPAATISISGGFGVDLNRDFGNGQNARLSPLQGMTPGWLLHCEVTEAFTASAFPVLQVHLALSTTVTMINGNPFFIGQNCPSIHSTAGRVHPGWGAAELTLGTQFYIRPNPFTAKMGRTIAGASVDAHDYRYIGLVCTVPNYDVASTNFTAGKIKGRFVFESDVFQEPADYIYPSGVKID